jgi:hypothetical protein
MAKYLVVNIEDGCDYWKTDDLTELIMDIFEAELEDEDFEEVKERFFDSYIVFVSESDIIEYSTQ